MINYDEPISKAKDNLSHYSHRIKRGEIVVLPKLSTYQNKSKLELFISGIIKTPINYTKDKVIQFENYPNLFDFVTNCVNNLNKGVLTVYAVLLKHILQSIIHYQITDDLLTFQIVEGTLQGCIGIVSFEEIEKATTMIAIQANITRSSFHVPDFLIKWGVNWVLAKGVKNFKRKIERTYSNLN